MKSSLPPNYFLAIIVPACQLRRLDSILVLTAWDPRYIASERTHRECRLQHLFYCCVTSPRTCLPSRSIATAVRVTYCDTYYCVRTLPSNGCFSATTVLILSKCTTIYISQFENEINKTCCFEWAGHSSRAVRDMNCLRLRGRWDYGFESHSRHGCLVCVCVYSVIVFCV
jgi:hypothetical protein